MASSQHFSDHELACHHCHINGATPELVNALEVLRDLISQQLGRDTPVYIDSAYRCSQYDMQIQSGRATKVTHSQHVLGNAADIRVAGLSAIDLYRFAVKVPAFKGIGRDDLRNYLHVDVREGPARWCYAADGSPIAWTAPPDPETQRA